MLNPQADSFETIRRRVVPPLGALVHVLNEAAHSDLYVEGNTTHNQFVGRIPMGEEEAEDVLADLNFERNPLASLKHLTGTREREEGSFRWLGEHNDDYRDDFQLHVILYDGKVVPNAKSGETYVYAHWEYRWDVAPFKHYKGVKYQPVKGVRMMREMLTAHDIPYDQTRPSTE